MNPISKPPCLLATRNKGKLREIRAALSQAGIDLRDLPEPDEVPDALESGSTFSENARFKARHYSNFTGLSVLAEDSGLSVDALDGRPGVHSARFASTDQERIRKVLSMLAALPEGTPRKARFVSSICLLLPDRTIEVFGEAEGEIALSPRGEDGFGYDPIFYYPPAGKTFAEMTLQEKAEVSHRGRALKKLVEALNAL